MNKNRVKKAYDAIRALAIKKTASEFSCSEQWVRQVIISTTTTGRADDIRKRYNQNYSAFNAVKSL
jgi:hypothetical protein